MQTLFNCTNIFYLVIFGYYPLKSNKILFNGFSLEQYIPPDLQFVNFSRAKFSFTLARLFLIHEEKYTQNKILYLVDITQSKTFNIHFKKFRLLPI